MEDYTNRDIASAIIRSNEGDFCVSLYLDIELKPENTTFMELVKECRTGFGNLFGVESHEHHIF